ncbi:MAG TPA: cytochrome P450 [Acidimicrobiales bacterium]|nr:cytochrome P450 [Acidimicrobiales bacterium]
MATVEQLPQGEPQGQGGQQRPNVTFDDLMPAKSDALWHFDHIDEHRQGGPVQFGDANGLEFWLLTTMAGIRDAFQQPAIFSNRAVIPYDPDPPYMWIPEMLDPPVHTKWRQLLGPQFAPGAVAKLETRMRQRFGEILDDVADRGGCDLVQDVALRFPNTIFMELMGLPVSDAAIFQVWERAILHDPGDQEGALNAMNEVIAYFAALVAERRKEPKDDLVSVALGWSIDGEPVPDADLLSMCLLMFMAGLDTVASQLSYSFLHLATHDDDRRRLVKDPSLIPSAIEEFLRYYAFVTPGRMITRDVEVGGCPMKAGQMIFAPLVAANRDPDEFPDADKVVIDRRDNRHIAFGAGPHRCLGSHLARQELRVALEEWHRRIPEYRLTPGVAVREHGGQIGLDNLPLQWDVSV